MKKRTGDAMVCITTFPSEVEAEIVSIHLESHGIHACSSTDDCGSWRPWLHLCNGVRLMALKRETDRASKLLMEMTSEETT